MSPRLSRDDQLLVVLLLYQLRPLFCGSDLENAQDNSDCGKAQHCITMYCYCHERQYLPGFHREFHNPLPGLRPRCVSSPFTAPRTAGERFMGGEAGTFQCAALHVSAFHKSQLGEGVRPVITWPRRPVHSGTQYLSKTSSKSCV